MKKEIEISENDLTVIKNLTLNNYRIKHSEDFTSDGFWGKCALEAVISVFFTKGVDINIKFIKNERCIHE